MSEVQTDENNEIYGRTRTSAEAKVSSKEAVEMAQYNVGLQSGHEKIKRKKKRSHIASNNNAIDHDPQEGTAVMKSSALGKGPTLSSSKKKEKRKKQKRQHNSPDTTSEIKDTDHEPQVSSCLFILDVTNNFESGNSNSALEVADTDSMGIKKNFDKSTVKALVSEKFHSFEKTENNSSMEKHDDGAKVNDILRRNGRMRTYRRKKQIKTYSRKKRPVVSLINSLDNKDSSLQIIPNSSMKGTSAKSSDEVLASGFSGNKLIKMLGHGTLGQVVESETRRELSVDLSCEPAFEENNKRMRMTFKESDKEHCSVQNVCDLDTLEKAFEQTRLDKVQNAILDGLSVEENSKAATPYCMDRSSESTSGFEPASKHLKQKNLEILTPSPEGPLIGLSKRKLLILDVNGLLADIVPYVPEGYKADITVGRKAVFKRPFHDDFLQFCFQRFDVGVWSSRMKNNVEMVLDFLMGDSKHCLLFRWHQSHCTDTGFNTIENKSKPLVLKELKKLWERHDPNLPWEKGVYNESNTLLLDDSPYKALRNPPHTAIFPRTYCYKDKEDNSLGPGGDLRVYLEGLAMAENVQKYVEQNPFGQRAITEANSSWAFYRRVLSADTAQPVDHTSKYSACG
ncbi:uncharacterized protein LOC131146539 [Malania oleifera]|uniref:uncharacterized protein LOC131146539 n=1 Tax=Malania oleifera TaxID=397392 RepID=UPI0025AE4B22|nr:uncharacterized protein LOC131146539 [Malania oleifera]XP_057952167.1 uncharacterized protein LOC131146539 [Malania oleifera]